MIIRFVIVVFIFTGKKFNSRKRLIIAWPDRPILVSAV